MTSTLTTTSYFLCCSSCFQRPSLFIQTHPLLKTQVHHVPSPGSCLCFSQPFLPSPHHPQMVLASLVTYYLILEAAALLTRILGSWVILPIIHVLPDRRCSSLSLVITRAVVYPSVLVKLNCTEFSLIESDFSKFMLIRRITALYCPPLRGKKKTLLWLRDKQSSSPSSFRFNILPSAKRSTSSRPEWQDVRNRALVTTHLQGETPSEEQQGVSVNWDG